MAKRPIRKLKVQDTQLTSPNMRRITLGGAALADFPRGQEGCYVKLMLPPEPCADLEGVHVSSPMLEGFVKRSYTVCAFDDEAEHLTLLAAHHERGGPATRWCATARPGDTVFVTGPGPVKGVPSTASSVLMAGDMTALPAITVWLARLPPSAVGHVVVEVVDPGDAIELSKPEGVELHWLVDPNPGHGSSKLAESVMALPWPPGSVAVWCACEYSEMKRLRSYLLETRMLERNDVYISSYWKAGDTDEEHKRAKKADAASK